MYFCVLLSNDLSVVLYTVSVMMCAIARLRIFLTSQDSNMSDANDAGG